MFRAYLIAALVGVGVFTYAQYRGWSMFDGSERLERGSTGYTPRHK